MDARIWAILSAIFAGITAILAKKGVEDIPPNTALLIRVIFVTMFAAILAGITKQAVFTGLTKQNWIFLAASALATFLSWLCYFRALQIGDVAQVAPIDKLSFVIAVILGFIVLREKVEPKTLIGSAFIVTGVLITLK